MNIQLSSQIRTLKLFSLAVLTIVLVGCSADSNEPVLPKAKPVVQPIEAQSDVQPTELTFGGRSTDRAYSVIQTSGGGYALAGETYGKGAGNADMWLVKVNSDGTTQWDKTFGGRKHDVAESAIQTSDGGYVLAGWTESKGAGNRDMWLVKVNSDGTT